MAKWACFATIVVVLVMVASTAMAQGGKKPGYLDAASTNYVVLDAVDGTGQERVMCLARGSCFLKRLECPEECPLRKPKRNRVEKGCFVDCSSKCETTCKTRLPNCNGYGSVCYDPRFVGGDGVMFYFHGAKGGDFALVSDDRLHVNAHFIGTRPQGRARDFTWVQALAVMFDSHVLTIAAKKVSKWEDNVDALVLRWDDEEIVLDDAADWTSITTTSTTVSVERTSDSNSVRVTVEGMLEMDVKVRAIGEEEDRVHGYHIPNDDAFAHLEMQFRYIKLTDQVEGVLGQTYRPGYVSPVKRGVPMPVMGGEDRYRTPSFLSPTCVSCRYHPTTTAVSTIATY